MAREPHRPLQRSPAPKGNKISMTSTIVPYLYVSLGGAAGSALRYGVDAWFGKSFTTSFPLGTLAVNVSSCFLMGIFAALAFTRGGWMGNEGRFLLMVGFCGGYSTLSALGLQSVSLFKLHQYGYAFLNMVGTPILCTLVLWAAYALGSWLFAVRLSN